MEQRKAERILCSLYALAAGLCLIVGITSGVTWSHWRWTLDQCIGRNCSCILYGESTPTHFIGGSIYTCIWITFGPIPIILLFGTLGIYHGVRSCIGPATEATRSVLTKNATGETIHMQIRTREIEPIPRVYWIIASTFSLFFAAYMLAHFALFADGFLYSCKQYRRELSKLLNLSGTAIDVVHSRLTCNAVFDFMDYLQPMVGNIYRGTYVNTAFALIVGIIASFFSTTALCLASVINIKFAAKQP